MCGNFRGAKSEEDQTLPRTRSTGHCDPDKAIGYPVNLRFSFAVERKDFYGIRRGLTQFFLSLTHFGLGK